MKKYYPEFHRIFKANVVEVCEGEGTKEDPGRLVFYVYTTEGNAIGRIDTLHQDMERVMEWTRNPIIK